MAAKNSSEGKARQCRKGLFTDRYIKSLKPESKMYQIREGRGFAIRILPSGVKTWYYVYSFGGKRRQLNLGNYPDTSLQEAHDSYRRAVELVKGGIDPQEPLSAANQMDTSGLSVAELISMYLEHIENHLVPLSVLQQARTLKNDVFPTLGGRRATDVKRKDAIKLIELVAGRAPGQGRNVLKTARAMFSFALMREMVEQNPFSCIAKAVPSIAPRERSRTLAVHEIKKLWRAIDDGFIGRALFLILLTGQRPGEVVGMRWSELEGDWWVIPAERSKNGRENRVPLLRFTKQILPERFDEDYVFPARGKGRGVGAVGTMRPGTLSHFLTDNDYFQLPRWTPHDLRRTMATGVASLGCSDEIIDEILNHKKRGVRGVYNRHKYDNEKKKWLRTWTRYIIHVIKS
ncbi:MAG: integrase arm-type DNA-binding domain-containing protein [Syntrophotaleaceae bacterium]